MLRSSLRQLARGLVHGAELDPIEVGLLEVVAEDLLVLPRPGIAPFLEPGRAALVQNRPDPLRNCGVCGFANEVVTEAKALAVRERTGDRPDEVPADEPIQIATERAPVLFGIAEACERLLRELPADDRGTLDDRALAGAEAVEPRGEERLDRGRGNDVPVEAALGQHGEHLLDEERVALRRLRDPRPGLPWKRPVADDLGDEELRLLVRESLEQHRGRADLPPAPRGALLQELGAREAEEQDRDVAGEVDDGLDEVEEGGLRPLKVVEDEQQGEIEGERLEQLADRPERLVARGLGVGAPDSRGDPRRNDLRVRVVGKQRGDRFGRRGPRGLLHDLGERPERDALPVGEAATGQDRGPARNQGAELGGQARLADSGGTEEREERRRPLSGDTVEGLLEQAQLVCPADHRRLPPSDERGVGSDVEEAEGVTGGLERGGLPEELVRPFADENLPGACALLESRSRVDRLAGDRSAGHDLSGLDADAGQETDPPVPLELLVQARESLSQLARRPDGSERVVLVHDRYAEDGHQAARRELGDASAVALGDAGGGLENLSRDAKSRLRVEPSAFARQVEEEDGDRLAHLAWRRRRGGRLRLGRGRGRRLERGVLSQDRRLESLQGR
jgi:hypothetical protein